MTVIELHAAALTYPGPPSITALRPCDFVAERGEYVAIVGPSGSGKSTMLNVLGLLDRPTEGTYLLNGFDTSAIDERTRAGLRAHEIGFVFQSFHLLPYRTALENVMLAHVYRGTPTVERRQSSFEALEKVGLGHRLNATPLTLSGGEQQRVAIARALAGAPSLLLCDEPTGNLDSVTANAVLDLIDDSRRGDMTVVMITHDLRVAGRAERVARIQDGVFTE